MRTKANSSSWNGNASHSTEWALLWRTLGYSFPSVLSFSPLPISSSRFWVSFTRDSHLWLCESSVLCPKILWFHLFTNTTFDASTAWTLKNLYLLTMYLPSPMLIIILKSYKIFSSLQESNLFCMSIFPPNAVLFTNMWYPSILLKQSLHLGYDSTPFFSFFFLHHSFILSYLYTSYKRNFLHCITILFFAYFLLSTSICWKGPFRIMVADLLGCILGTAINGKYSVSQVHFPSATSIVVSSINLN